jgi:hypothetical protein
MVKDGVLVLAPVYFVGLAATSILFDTPLVIVFHCTEVAEGVAMTTHCSVTEFPRLTDLSGPTLTVGLPKIK